MATKTKTQTKNAAPSLSPKQAQVKVTNLIKGIDNMNVAIAKKQEENVRAVEELKTLMPIALTQPGTPVQVGGTAKGPGTAKVKDQAKEAKKPAAKANGSAKPAATAKAVAKPSLKEAPGERPALKQVIHDLIAKGGNKPMTKPELYNAAIAKFGKWSRQSFYNAIKDTKHFLADGEGFVNVVATRSQSAQGHGEKDEADRFVESVERNQATSAVV